MGRWLGLFLLMVMAVLSGCAGRAASAPQVNCAAAPTTPDIAANQVAVFFTCNGDPVPSDPRAVSRQVGVEQAGVKAALEELLKGPTSAEKERGFSSFFSRKTTGMLRSVTVTADGLAVVDFADFQVYMNNASTSAGSAQLMGQLNRTVFQFDGIRAVEYRFDGSCDAFFNWLQSDCQVIARDR